jgi:hypothetical protein
MAVSRRSSLSARHQSVGEHLPCDLELLGNRHRNAGGISLVDDGPFLGSKHPERLRPLKKRIQTRIGLHQLDAVLLRLQALVDLDERHDSEVDQRLRGRLACDLPIHRPLEQDGPDHLAVAEAGRRDDPLTHLVDQVEHLLIVAPSALLDAVALERLGG